MACLWMLLGENTWGAGGTLFWRNPSKALIGVTGSNVQIGSDKAYNAGITSELYIDDISLLTDFGYLHGDKIDAGGYTDARLNWYVIDNLMLGTGCSYSNDITSGLINMEYMPDIEAFPGLSLFVDSKWGESGYHSIVTGMKYYFGEGVSLKEKHRKDDPPNKALSGLTLFSQGEAFTETETETSGDSDDVVADDVVCR